MSLYLSVDNSSPSVIASNDGWSEFSKWVDGLDMQQAGELIHLCDHGWSQKPAEVETELRNAVHGGDPSDNVKGVADSIVSLIDKQSQMLTVTNGVIEDDNSLAS